MLGSGPKASINVARMAAPVGVVNSQAIADSASGISRSNSAVAGAGMLTSPWAIRTRPLPVGTGEATSRSTPSRSQPTAVPTMSAIESAAPTSWKCTFSTVTPCTLASASARRVKIRPAISFCRSESRPAWIIAKILMQVAMGMFRLILDRDLGRAKAQLLHLACDQAATGQPQRADGLVEFFQRHAGIDQRAEHHVAADAACTIEIGDFHCLSLPRRSLRDAGVHLVPQARQEILEILPGQAERPHVCHTHAAQHIAKHLEMLRLKFSIHDRRFGPIDQLCGGDLVLEKIDQFLADELACDFHGCSAHSRSY